MSEQGCANPDCGICHHCQRPHLTSECQEARIASLETDRDRWKAVVRETCEGMECEPECDSYGHANECPVAHPEVAWSRLRARVSDLERERDAWKADSLDEHSGRMRMASEASKARRRASDLADRLRALHVHSQDFQAQSHCEMCSTIIEVEQRAEGLAEKAAELAEALRECLIQSPHSTNAPAGCLCRWCKARRLLALDAKGDASRPAKELGRERLGFSGYVVTGLGDASRPKVEPEDVGCANCGNGRGKNAGILEEPWPCGCRYCYICSGRNRDEDCARGRCDEGDASRPKVEGE